MTLMTGTMAEREAEFSPRENARAREAREVELKIAYPSAVNLKHAIRTGAVPNAPVSTRDVGRAEVKWGPMKETAKGKRTGQTSAVIPKGSRSMASTFGSLHCNLMFVNRQILLVSLCKPLQYLLFTQVSSKSSVEMRRALQEQVADLRVHGIRITHLHSDSESGIRALEPWMKASGLTLDLVAGSESVQPIERVTRLVKGQMRAVLRGIPYPLPRTLLAALCKYRPVVRASNWENAGHEKGALAFGDSAQVHQKSVSSGKVPRTTGCIWLYPVLNLSGSWVFCDLGTPHTIARQRWTQVPVPHEVIARMSGIESKMVGPVDMTDSGMRMAGSDDEAGDHARLDEETDANDDAADMDGSVSDHVEAGEVGAVYHRDRTDMEQDIHASESSVDDAPLSAATQEFVPDTAATQEYVPDPIQTQPIQGDTVLAIPVRRSYEITVSIKKKVRAGSDKRKIAHNEALERVCVLQERIDAIVRHEKVLERGVEHAEPKNAG
ncbi:hypothetical protein FVE85_8553 [Porphyridium purpureum]|uniref:Uncharacterized protein n=1 Tax=Porphyridium purpureum TaxID=35688 RepID=A0A5J4YP80_PORPP|nr:hypothetical protein FVE85_8553 [Porphyridium purpureum]|eukprot:POR8751..scf296_7